MQPTCDHNIDSAHQACSHCFGNIAHDEYGEKRYTGQGKACIYLCNQCRELTETELELVGCCQQCVQTIEDKTYWIPTGEPEILRTPQPFQFSARDFHVPALANCKLLALAPLKNTQTAAIILTSRGQLHRLDLSNGDTQLIATYDDASINLRNTHVELILSDDHQFAAITSVFANQDELNTCGINKGIVIDLHTGNILMPLECGDYHTDKTAFPVAFFTYQGKTLMVHATNWNHLDISEPRSGECFTQRDPDHAPKPKEPFTNYTEWSGALDVSPGQRKIATIGWMWHPIGTAYSWDLAAWMQNCWEADSGESKHTYQQWMDFWHGSLCWLDDEKIAIWGYDELEFNGHFPANSLAVYNTTSGKLIDWFAGPGDWPFFYDDYLFTNNTDNNGLSVWSIASGSWLHDEPGLLPRYYHPGCKTFISIQAESPEHISLHQWHSQPAHQP